MMKRGTSLASVLLTIVSLAHLLRLVFHTQVTIADKVVPMWVSGVAFLGAGVMAVVLWRDARK